MIKLNKFIGSASWAWVKSHSGLLTALYRDVCDSPENVDITFAHCTLLAHCTNPHSWSVRWLVLFNLTFCSKKHHCAYISTHSSAISLVKIPKEGSACVNAKPEAQNLRTHMKFAATVISFSTRIWGRMKEIEAS